MAKAHVKQGAYGQDSANNDVVAVGPFEFRHVLEIHAVDPGDSGGYGQDGGPGGQPAGAGILLRLSCHQAYFEGEGKHLAERIDVLLHALDMVGDISKERLHLAVDRQRFGMLQPVADIDERNDCLSQAQQLATQHVETVDLGLMKRATEHSLFQFIDLPLDRLDNGHVVVDDEVQDGIEDVVLAAGEDGGTGLESFTNSGV